MLKASRSRLLAAMASCTLAVCLLAVQRETIPGISSQFTLYLLPHPFCDLWHGGALLFMCSQRRETCAVEHSVQTVRARFHTGGVFGAPILTDGSLNISQGAAATAYLGEKLGFASGIPGTAKGMQLLLDINDFTAELDIRLIPPFPYNPNGPLTSQHLDAKVASGRYDLWLAYFEDILAGHSFFFGDVPTYVDYYLVSHLMFLEYALQNTDHANFRESELVTKYTKVSGMWTRLAWDWEALARRA